MTELVSALFRVAGYLSLAWLVGGATFLLLSGPSADNVLRAWRVRCHRSFLWAVAVFAIATAATLIAQTAATIDLPLERMIEKWDWLESFARETRQGRVAILRLVLAPVLFVAALRLAAATSPRAERAGAGLLLAPATIAVAAGSFAGHAAGGDVAPWLLPLHIAHALAASAWVGGLPAWIGLVLAIAAFATTERCAYAAVALARFSRLATLCMIAIVVSGVALGLGSVETQGDLLGTRYGLLICGKVAVLAGILLIAHHLRRAFLPSLAAPSSAARRHAAAARWVALELALATVVLALAGLLSQTTPAAHDQPSWWLPVRVAIDATWPLWPTPLWVGGGIAVATFAAAWLLWRRVAVPALQLTAVAAVGLAGLATAVWWLTVPAFPDTYRRSTVSYLTVSIAEGKKHFGELCTSCHGTGGLGDGPAAKALPKPPANLSEPHTALHTAGDMYWWLAHGIPPSGMPGFADALNDEARWDVINFLRAFSQGFQARVLSPAIAPHHPWLGAPGFYLEGTGGAAGELKDFRERSNVLLVFPDPDDAASRARLRELDAARDRLQADALTVLVVSGKIDAGAAGAATVVRGGADEIRQAYELLSRTLVNRGDGRSIGMMRRHMEFLIDRFGYIRGRWIMDEDSGGWSPIDRLLQQVEELNKEPRLLPPPDDHVH